MSTFVQDLRYAFRTLIKNPGFTTVAVLTLALGIGANVATYSVVYGVLLKPLPFPQPDQLVRVFDDQTPTNEKDIGMSVPELADLQERSGVFREISAVSSSNSAVAGGDRIVRAESLVTSPDYFTLLGAKPELGRVYTQQDAVPGFLEPVVISNGFWRRYYGSDPKHHRPKNAPRRRHVHHRRRDARWISSSRTNARYRRRSLARRGIRRRSHFPRRRIVLSESSAAQSRGSSPA